MLESRGMFKKIPIVQRGQNITIGYLKSYLYLGVMPSLPHGIFM